MFEERNSAILTKGNSKTDGPRTYIVFGVMRGGTSMVGGVMRGLGVFLGPEIADKNHESQMFVGRPVPEMKETIKKCNEEHKVWGWKYPNAADYLDRVWCELRNPHLICVYRDPISNARGLNRWHPIGPIQGAHESLLRQQKNLAMTLIRGCPSLLISYEKAVRHKEQFVEELGEWVGIKPDHNKFDFAGFMSTESYKAIDDYRKQPRRGLFV